MRSLITFFIGLLGLMVASSAMALDLPKPLVKTDWLATHLDQVNIIDIRADAKSFMAQPTYIKDKKTGKSNLVKVGGHIPGAKIYRL